MTNSAANPTKEDIAKQEATRYLADKIYLYLLGKSQPVKLRQLTKAIDVDGLTPRLLRHVMAGSDRFACVDRRWTVGTRFGNTKRPFERILVEILTNAGVPVALDVLAEEMALVLSRSADYYRAILPRILSDPDEFFKAGESSYGLASWLLIPTSDSEQDVVFDNFLSQDQVEQFTASCPQADWTTENIADAAAAIVKDTKEPIPLKILALMAWRALKDDFEPVDFYSAVISDERIVTLSDQRGRPASVVEDYTKTLVAMADELALLPMESEEEEDEGPVQVTDSDKEEIVALILERGEASAEELLEAVVEVSPGEPAFSGALDSLKQALNADERVMWVGGTRWRKVETFPDEVKVIPESLIVPRVSQFETPEGDVYDQELEEEGFDGNLKAAIYDPLAEDVTDEDPARTMYQENGPSQRCVLKYHHKMEGTFPLCQINPDFFGTKPEIIPIVLNDEGKRKNVYVNNATRLIYGLKDFYTDITEVSGAVFYIEKTQKPGEYRFRYENETDEQLDIDVGRSLELLDIRARFESQEMPIFDVVTEILEQRRQGMTFAQLVNEVNIVKRCSRLLIASILSSYHCFHTRGKSGLWQYDEKKRSQGFNKTKRKYIKK